MTFSRIAGLVFPLIVIGSADASALDLPDTAKPVVQAIRIEGDLKLTGDLSDPRWQLAQPVEMKYEVTPGENTPAPQRTFVRVLYNKDNIYFGVDCQDSNPSAIRAHITDRDKMFDDDFFDVILDTYGDFQRGYEIVVNPYGIQGDLLMTSGNEDPSYDMVWESEASIGREGWKAEMAIPFKSLRFPAIPVQNWHIVFIRNMPRASRVQMSWVPLDRNNPCLLCQDGLLKGIQDVQSVTTVDLLPYVVGQESGALNDFSNPSSSFDNGKIKGRVGIGLRYSPTPDVSVEGVVNPDFSQVESDATQISVNSNFALFYPEKRPFFLTNSDIFQNQTQTFYSRTINNPLGAARVNGKSGSFSFAYLAASDRNTPFIVPGEETSDYVATDLQSFSNVARAKYDLGDESFIGGTVITRNTGSAHNYVGGFDWNYKFWANWYFQGETFYTDTKEVNDTTLLESTRTFGSTGKDAAFNGQEYGGLGSQLVIRRDGRTFGFWFRYIDRSPLFQAQDGFVPSNDQRMGMFNEYLQFYPNDAFIDNWSIGANAGLHFNHDQVRKE
ncbi:MAG TPA: carbohydrate binding family 9 domain-containing protein, partial [Bacteroidota bacterium]|nr:carbohydrate binding family 9 domain-containing protein [Bacteroidota bacterium]